MLNYCSASGWLVTSFHVLIQLIPGLAQQIIRNEFTRAAASRDDLLDDIWADIAQHQSGCLPEGGPDRTATAIGNIPQPNKSVRPSVLSH